MILKVTSNSKIPLNIYLCLSQRNFLHIVIVSVSMNSIISISIKHILLIIFCNDDRDQMLWGYWHVFLYNILYNCKMPMQILFQIKFPPNRCLVTSWENRCSPYWSTWWFDSVHSFPWVCGHFLVFRVNVSWNGYLTCTFTSIINWFNISDLFDAEKDPKVLNSPVLV